MCAVTVDLIGLVRAIIIVGVILNRDSQLQFEIPYWKHFVQNYLIVSKAHYRPSVFGFCHLRSV